MVATGMKTSSVAGCNHTVYAHHTAPSLWLYSSTEARFTWILLAHNQRSKCRQKFRIRSRRCSYECCNVV